MRVFIKHARASLIRPGVSPRPHRLDHPRPRTSPADDVNPPDPSPSPARRACVTGAHRELAEEGAAKDEEAEEFAAEAAKNAAMARSPETLAAQRALADAAVAALRERPEVAAALEKTAKPSGKVAKALRKPSGSMALIGESAF